MINTEEQLRLHDIIDSLKEKIKMLEELVDRLSIEKAWDCRSCGNTLGFYAPLQFLPRKMHCPDCGVEMILRGETSKQS